MTIRVSSATRLGAIGGLLLAAAAASAQKGPAPSLLADDFANPATGWDVETNPQAGYRIEYAGGQYQISAPGQSLIILATNGLEFADGRVGVEAANLPLSPPSPHGVFVRGQDPGNFYALAVVSDGSFLAFHHVDSVYFTDVEGFLPFGLYRTDGPNLIEAVAAGSEIQYFVNGELIATATKVIWPNGVAGLFSITITEQPAGTAFDNWRAEVVR